MNRRYFASFLSRYSKDVAFFLIFIAFLLVSKMAISQERESEVGGIPVKILVGDINHLKKDAYFVPHHKAWKVPDEFRDSISRAGGESGLNSFQSQYFRY